ncbi:MAG: RNA methyltransferase [Oscillospiraceae bacterium]|jgi:TrmH family RNA methyltransferase|nr:RNA methyltransferase [Oscillospiraceae bacterium]
MSIDIAVISSIQNEKIKHAEKIIKQPKYRQKSNQFAVEGIKLVKEVLKSEIKIDSIFITPESYEKYKQDLKNIMNNSTFIIYEVNNKIMNKISDMASPPGIICLCQTVDKTQMLDKIVKNNKIVILENIQDPHNLGTLFRICDAMKIKSVGVTKSSCDIYNPKVLRGSMGSVFRLDIFKVNDIITFISKLKKYRFEVYASTADKNDSPISKIKYGKKIAVIIGNEGSGISPETIKLCDKRVTIPTNQEIDSLNAAVAAGIIIWEITGRGEFG